jgi:hypothetical protein
MMMMTTHLKLILMKTTMMKSMGPLWKGRKDPYQGRKCLQDNGLGGHQLEATQ